MFERASYVLSGEDGMGTLEYGIIIFIVLMIAIAFFAFKDSVKELFSTATDKVDMMKSNLSSELSSGLFH